MRGPAVVPGPRGESAAQRDDRNLAELLQELRVAGLGVQVLFGFLLCLPSHRPVRPAGALIAICVGCVFGALWFAFPQARRR
jgi:hypothetical protein